MRSAVMSCVVSYSRWQQLLCLSLLIGIIHRKDNSHKFREQLVVFKSLSASFLSATPATSPTSFRSSSSGSSGSGASFESRNEALETLVSSLGAVDLLGRPSSSLLFSGIPSFPVGGEKQEQEQGAGVASGDGVKVYACLQSLMKMHPLFDAIIAQVSRCKALLLWCM
jgi:hypothetical protein